MSGNRRGATVDAAQRAVDHHRRLELNSRPSYAPLPLTRDRLNWLSTVGQLDNTFLPGQYKPNISKLQFIDFISLSRQPFADAFVLPGERERTALIVAARRARSQDSRYAVTVGMRGGITSTPALPPMQDYISRPLSARNAWPRSYTEEKLQARTVFVEGAAQTKPSLWHTGASVDLKEPATAESDAFMDELFDFDGAVKAIDAFGRANGAEIAAVADTGANAAEDVCNDGMMEEL